MFEPSAPQERPWVRKRLRVPKDNGSLYSQPRLDEGAGIIDANRALFESVANRSIQGRTLGQLRAWTRQAVLDAAVTYTSALRGEPAQPVGSVDSVEQADRPLVVGGHQPALFHPGVWAKNFAVGRLAAEADGIGLHLVIDNDTLSGTRLIVPRGDREHPSLETIPVDADRPVEPWEESRVLDRRLFESFPARAREALAPWGIEPLATTVWNDALDGAGPSNTLRDAFTTVRHRLECRWGLRNLEVPLSAVSTLDPFHWFTGHILAHLPRFRSVYNAVVAEYRRVNRVRSRTHPVPDLKMNDDWLEAPFWVWRAGDRVRGRVFAKQIGRQVALSDGRAEFARLRLAPDMDACCAVEGLRELADRGIRFRTRALTTTLFARLCLSDVFVHGIGGSKYDEMTDRLCARFLGLPSPDYVTVSATVPLPIGPPHNVTAADERRLEHLLRDLRWNADRHLGPGLSAEVDALRAERARLIEDDRQDRFATTEGARSDGARSDGEQSAVAQSAESVGATAPRPTRKERHRARADRFHRLHDIASKLVAFARDQQTRATEDLAAIHRHREANGVLCQREFSFVLHPEQTLRPFLQDLSHGV